MCRRRSRSRKGTLLPEPVAKGKAMGQADNSIDNLEKIMTDYKLLCRQLEIFAEEDPGFVPLLSNASALLWEALPDINWAGFYLVTEKSEAEAAGISPESYTEAVGISLDSSCPENCGAESFDSLRLVLGPFQGKPACIHIEYGKGVCGTAWAQDRTQLVADVHQFPGHIACDSASNSEIVVPIHLRPARCGAASEPASAGGRTSDVLSAVSAPVIAVLDIDSPLFDRFTESDREGLEAFVRALEASLSLESVSFGVNLNENAERGAEGFPAENAAPGAPRDLSVLRLELEETDRQLLMLFERRMELSREVGQYKKEKGLPVLDSAKEAQKIQAAKEQLPEELKEYGARFQQMLMDLGKELQQSLRK